jgi:predicted dehydrogenase
MAAKRYLLGLALGSLLVALAGCDRMDQLACGAQGVFQANKLVAGRGNFQRIELYGDRGSLVYQADPGFEAGWTGRVLAGRPGETALTELPLPATLTEGLTAPDPAGRLAAYRRLTDPFFAAVARGDGAAAGPDTPSFRDGAAVQAVLDAVAISAERGAWVEVA